MCMMSHYKFHNELTNRIFVIFIHQNDTCNDCIIPCKKYLILNNLFSAPGYISRSVAGSYDNEGIAIFALQFTYFLWVRAL